jgi:hypothetical protein
VKVAPLWLLLAGMAAQFLWQWAPTWAQADAWNAAGAIFIALLLGVLAVAYHRAKEMLLVCGYLAVLWLLTAGCSLLWLKEQWEVSPGQDQCDAQFKFPLSVIGLFIGLVLLIRIRSAPDGQGSKH